jgi:hypothetical protein
MDIEKIVREIVEKIQGENESDRIESFLTAYEMFLSNILDTEKDFEIAFNIIKYVEMRLCHIRDDKLGFLNIERFRE